MAVITIIGSGMMGSALAFPARENGNEVRLVGTHLDREIIEACWKTNRHPKFTKDFPEGVKYYQIEEFKEALIDTDVVIGGPCTSYELVAHDQTEVAFCGKDREVLSYLKSLMQTDYYHISTTTDVTGIESAVALKNGYALGIALTIGLNQKLFQSDELHFNSQAAVFGQASKEMYKLLNFQGALSLENLSVGIGDLYVTVYGGRTRLVGILLGKGLNIDEAKAELNGVTLESLVVSERVARAVKRNIEKGVLKEEDFPLLLHIDEILSKKTAVAIPWEKFTFAL